MSAIVSVVIPIYNVERFLKECVDSVLNQTYSDIELILVDDGSTDNSGKICDAYANLDDRVIVVHKPNGGASSARNVGMKIASGKYIYFLDSDDYIDEITLDKLILSAEVNNSDIVFMNGILFNDGINYCKFENKYKHIKQYDEQTGRELLEEQFSLDDYYVLVQLMLFNREYLNNQNLNFYEGIIFEDELFVFSALYYAHIVSHVNEQLLHRRMREGSVMTSSSKEKRYISAWIVFEKLVKEFIGRVNDDAVVCQRLQTSAKSVYYKYNALNIELKKQYEKSFQSFKILTKKYKGFGNLKLLEKCSDGIAKGYYHLKRKVLKNEDSSICN